MCLSNGILVGLCYGFSFAGAQLSVLWGAELRRSLAFDGRTILRMIVVSLLVAILYAGTIKLFGDWVVTRPPHLCMSRPAFMALSWVAAAPGVAATMTASRLAKAGPADILARHGWKITWRGTALGLVASGAVVFGGHLWWGEGA